MVGPKTKNRLESIVKTKIRHGTNVPYPLIGDANFHPKQFDLPCLVLTTWQLFGLLFVNW